MSNVCGFGICLWVFLPVRILCYQPLYVWYNLSFIFSFAWPTSLYCEEYVCTHISHCMEIVYELPLLPNNTTNVTFFTNQEWCKVFPGYLSLGYRVGGDCANTWHCTKCFTFFFSTGSGRSPSYFQIFCLIAFLKETIIRNII